MIFIDYFKNNVRYVLPAAYFISLIIACSISLCFESRLIVVWVYFILLVITLFFHFFVYKTFVMSNLTLKRNNKLLSLSLQTDSLIYLIVNGPNIVSYYQSEKFGLENMLISNVDQFVLILKKLNVSISNVESILNFIHSKERDNQKLTQTIGPLSYNNIQFNIIFNYLDIGGDSKAIKFVDKSHSDLVYELRDQESIGYYELDKLGFVTQINDYLANILGYTASEIISSYISLGSLIDIKKSFGERSNNEKVTNLLNGNWQGVLAFNNKHDEIVYMVITQKPIIDESGRIKHIIGYALKLNDQLLISQSKENDSFWVDHSWSCFFEESPYPAIMLDKYGKILRTNAAFEEILPDRLLDKNFIELFTEDGQEKIKKQANEVLSKKAKPAQLKGLRLKNNDRILDIYASVIYNMPDKDIFGFMVRITDITKQNELKESLSHAQRMQTIGHLVGSVAHDFNNILTAIAGFCDLLLMRHTVGDPSFAHIIQIKQSSDRASNLVKRLLAFSRKQTLKLQIVNLNDLFSDFTTLIQRLVGSDTVLVQDVDPNIWLVKVDIVQMEQVILNLAVNAHQAMGEGGKLSIKVYNVTLHERDPYLDDYTAPSGEDLPPPGQYVAIEVEDTGCGIDAGIVKQIFEPFFTTKIDKSGTGLGLSTVYGIVRQSDGYIYVKSKVGVGTNFLIYLKRHHYSNDDIEEIKSTEKDNASSQMGIKRDLSGKGIIALIEDEESIRLFAKSALTNKGYEVIEFSSAKQALENIKPYLDKIDLIISDVMMPEMSGPALIKEIRKMRPSMKIIFISGYGEEAFTKEYGESRDFDFIPKPFTLKQLASKVKEVIERS